MVITLRHHKAATANCQSRRKCRSTQTDMTCGWASRQATVSALERNAEALSAGQLGRF